MILNFWESIREEIIEIFTNISLGSLITLFFGIVIGILIAIICYATMFTNKLKKKEKDNNFKSANLKKKDKKNLSKEEKEDLEKLETEQIELIKNYIESSKKEYLDEGAGLGFGEKITIAKDVGYNMALSIAKVYYPKSKHPLFELSIEELIMLDRYIADRIEGVFDSKVLRVFKKVKVSQILTILDAKKKIDDSKIVKSAKKMRIGGIGKIVMSAVNLINPGYWIKKSLMKITTTVGTDKVVCIILGIIGEEVAKIYSKNVFISSEEQIALEEELKEIEEEEPEERKEK